MAASGSIALELGQLVARLGTQVTILERAGRILKDHAPEVSSTLTQLLREEDLTIRTRARVVSVQGDQRQVKVAAAVRGQRQAVSAARLLVATGRAPNTCGLGLERGGVRLDAGGAVVVEEELRTSVPHIWAAGDVIGRETASQMATPVGAHDGGSAARNALTGTHQRVHHRVIPRAIFTAPPVGVVGLADREATAAGIVCTCNTVPLTAVPRTGAIRDTRGSVKARRCAVVASLLATDPRKADILGKDITHDLYAIFQREREQSVQPVQKEDAAEVLRRRFFTPESIRDRNAFRPHVVAAAQGIFALDEQSARDRARTEEHLLESYPFHPSLTDIFYTKWTNLEGFQRTRGVLRTFALALRDAEAWDQSPLVGVNVFLSRLGDAALSEAAREVTIVAETEEYEGKRQAWTQILAGELAKARDIQQESPSLHFREVEQAVFATFLHSQPIGQRASTRDLMLLLGPTRPGKIDLEKALRRWAVRIHLAAAVTRSGPTPPEPPKPSPGILTAVADLRPSEIQNLADQIGDLARLATTAGVDLRFHLRVDLGDGREVPADTLAKVSKLLESVKSGFTLH